MPPKYAKPVTESCVVEALPLKSTRLVVADCPAAGWVKGSTRLVEVRKSLPGIAAMIAPLVVVFKRFPEAIEVIPKVEVVALLKSDEPSKVVEPK